jgi:hypothetical protein
MKAEQIDILLHKNVEMVCFSQYSVYIHLAGGAILTVESGFEHTHDKLRRGGRTKFPITDSGLMTILESTIESVRFEASGELHLSFSNGDTLLVFKEPEYESYRIKIADKEFIA